MDVVRLTLCTIGFDNVLISSCLVVYCGRLMKLTKNVIVGTPMCKCEFASLMNNMK